ncbi:A/G-specific adenine glycosylase [Treponema zuelzerae]|uniref:A/G-specific adenine glycosylase n=1 Tax=Teretinema zuelzerae TaxID=156 RepID=A0AAE3EJM2_9SPIR|nr:A/G-specific adenine glycosylase [Teretinema zuelzerae]MCD1654668.1 A/G-specific adenine glycosylase [Teretinema zuelzerae]
MASSTDANLPPQKAVSEFQHTILDHYQNSGRAFPWRETRDPYAILVSEFMLQQTQTDRVVPKYLAWMSRFPTVESLASSTLSEVLEQWSGLGYNRRARFLRETAMLITKKHGSLVPEDPEALDSLPGIGPYTARAISTFSYGLPHAFIETNIRAVYLFFFFPEKENVPDSEVLSIIERTVWKDDPRSWYYALMDYGAELKKKVHNPNRRSKHYSKQSPFEGSLRQARGAVIRQLGNLGRSDSRTIAAAENLPEEKVSQALSALCLEGMVAEDESGYYIP